MKLAVLTWYDAIKSVNTLYQFSSAQFQILIHLQINQKQKKYLILSQFCIGVTWNNQRVTIPGDPGQNDYFTGSSLSVTHTNIALHKKIHKRTLSRRGKKREGMSKMDNIK